MISFLPFLGCHLCFLASRRMALPCQLRRRTLGDEAAAFRNDETLSSFPSTVYVKRSSSLPEVELGKRSIKNVMGSFSSFCQGRGMGSRNGLSCFNDVCFHPFFNSPFGSFYDQFFAQETHCRPANAATIQKTC